MSEMNPYDLKCICSKVYEYSRTRNNLANWYHIYVRINTVEIAISSERLDLLTGIKLIINGTSSTFSQTPFFTLIKAYTMGIQKVIKPSIKTRLLIKFISIGESGMADSFCGFGRTHHGVSINRTPVFCRKTTQFGERLSRWKLTEMMSAKLLYLRKSNHFALNQKDASRI